jgi:3-hydroxyisobutyrate dehydrogenase-like beta-hydroxyacid dehydrogenase
MNASVGFIGLGNMGNPMALNVLKGGFTMTVFDIDSKTMKNLVDGGARGAASAREVAQSSDVVVTSLPGSPEVEAAYLTSGGLIDSAKSGAVLVDLSSVLPSTPRKLEARAR